MQKIQKIKNKDEQKKKEKDENTKKDDYITNILIRRKEQIRNNRIQ